MNPAHQVCATLLSQAEVCCSTLHPKRNSRLYSGGDHNRDAHRAPRVQASILCRCVVTVWDMVEALGEAKVSGVG